MARGVAGDVAVLFLILLGGIAVGVTGGGRVGLAVPYVLRLLQRDPQVAAGPIALAGGRHVDAAGVLQPRPDDGLGRSTSRRG